MNPKKILLSSAAMLLLTAQYISADPGAVSYAQTPECNGPICKKEGIIVGSILGAVGLALLAYCACKKKNENNNQNDTFFHDSARNNLAELQQVLVQPNNP